MMSSLQCSRQHLCMCVIALLCLLSYLMYSNLDINLTSFSICKKVVQNPNASLQVVQNPNVSLQVVQNPNCPQSTRTEDDVIILLWFWPFGAKGNVRQLRCSDFDMVGCRLTDDRSVYHKAHAVLFHHRDIHGGLDNMPPEPRPWFQKWIWFNMESPTNSALNPALNELFNLTSSYRLDSHIPVRYGYLTPVERKDETFKLPQKDKLVCWVVSNWKPHFKRVQVYEKMKGHVKIELYGRAFNRNLNNEDYLQLMPSCKFYLSWENSVNTDYLSEKLYQPMKFGTVPVVLGPSRRNYENHVPGDSFIHVDDFASPKELAERLIYLDNNHTEYMQYLKWRERYKVHRYFFIGDHACRSCQHLKMNKGYQVFHNLNKWYWG